MLETKEEIKAWLESMSISNYKINDDLTVDTTTHVDLYNKGLTSIPVQFGKVDHYFNCGNNRLENLKGSPHTVGTDFFCYSSQLFSLEGGPNVVGGDFDCSENNLTSLEFCPVSVGSMFDCSHNRIETLTYSPENVGVNFLCYNNPIKNYLEFQCKFKRFFKSSSPIRLPMFEKYYKKNVGGENFELELNINQMREIVDFERRKLTITNHHNSLMVELNNEKIIKAVSKPKI